MKIRKKEITFVFSILLALSHANPLLIPELIFAAELMEWAMSFVGIIRTTAGMTDSVSGIFHDQHSYDPQYINLAISRIDRALPKISMQLDDVSKLIDYRYQLLVRMIENLGKEIHINSQMLTITEHMGKINYRYTELLKRMKAKGNPKVDKQNLCTFASNLVHSDPLSETRALIRQGVLDRQLLDEINDKFKAHENSLCGTGYSAHDYFHSFHISLMFIEMKAFVTAALSYHVLSIKEGNGQYCQQEDPVDGQYQIELALKSLGETLQDYSRAMDKRMKIASREFRACDQGEDFIRDETYFELEGAIQTIVELPSDWFRQHQDMVNPYLKDYPKCQDRGVSYGISRLWCNSDTKFCKTFDSGNCLGYTRNCQDPSYWIRACVANNSSRRYEWLELGDYYEYPGELKETCERLSMIETLPWTSWDSRLTPCVCDCNDNDVDSLSTHVFNLQWVESDVSENMVITGIRFIVKHRIMQFQIQQGKLGTNFRVEEPEWKQIKDISEEIRAARLNKKFLGKSPGVVQNQDYFIVNQTVNNAMNFDTLSLPDSYVLTGVRFYFSPVNNEGGVERLQIAIKGTKFNHNAGKLDQDAESVIVTSKIRHQQRYHYPRKNVKTPRFPTDAIPVSGQYVEISASDLEHDSGQTTLPYFDALPLVSNPPAPLGGLGTFHKGGGDFTGFVSLKFLSLDYKTYMDESMKQLEERMRKLSHPKEDLSSLQRQVLPGF